MGAELLIFCGWLTGALKAIFMYMLTIGTNGALVKLVLGNILLLGLIVKIIPGDKDDQLLAWLQEKISNFRNKGEESDDEETK